MTEEIKGLMTVPEAAEWASVSVWTIHRALNRGDLQGYTLGAGGIKRTTMAYLEAWLVSYPTAPPKYRRST